MRFTIQVLLLGEVGDVHQDSQTGASELVGTQATEILSEAATIDMIHLCDRMAVEIKPVGAFARWDLITKQITIK